MIFLLYKMVTQLKTNVIWFNEICVRILVQEVAHAPFHVESVLPVGFAFPSKRDGKTRVEIVHQESRLAGTGIVGEDTSVEVADIAVRVDVVVKDKMGIGAEFGEPSTALFPQTIASQDFDIHTDGSEMVGCVVFDEQDSLEIAGSSHL